MTLSCFTFAPCREGPETLFHSKATFHLPLHLPESFRLSSFSYPPRSRHHSRQSMSNIPDDLNDLNFDEYDDEGDDDLIDDDMLMELLAIDDEELLGMGDNELDMTLENEMKELEELMSRRLEEDRLNLGETLQTKTYKRNSEPKKKSEALEAALLQGVVPASAGVGSKCLPGDYGFDPMNLATKDYFKQVQTALLNLLPEKEENKNSDPGAALPTQKFLVNGPRPSALILRDYREAEIRHGRLAMLAAILWPLQEIIDRLFMPNLFGETTLIYGGVTLPFVPLFMVLIMLLLGYLDIYAATIKENDAGDAFLPGECFWDPLSILEGAPDWMKRNMQQRELNNGRMAMLAVLSYIIQEGLFHHPLIDLPWNQILFEPAYEIPSVQAWLDSKFGGATREMYDEDVQRQIIEILQE